MLNHTIHHSWFKNDEHQHWGSSLLQTQTYSLELWSYWTKCVVCWRVARHTHRSSNNLLFREKKSFLVIDLLKQVASLAVVHHYIQAAIFCREANRRELTLHPVGALCHITTTSDRFSLKPLSHTDTRCNSIPRLIASSINPSRIGCPSNTARCNDSIKLLWQDFLILFFVTFFFMTHTSENRRISGIPRSWTKQTVFSFQSKSSPAAWSWVLRSYRPSIFTSELCGT